MNRLQPLNPPVRNYAGPDQNVERTTAPLPDMKTLAGPFPSHQPAPTSTGPCRKADIPAALDTLNSNLMLAAENLASLVQRIEPVLSPETPREQDKCCAKDQIVTASLALSVRNLSDKIASMAAFIASVTARVEL